MASLSTQSATPARSAMICGTWCWKYRLQFDRPAPAFVDEATWQVWKDIPAEERSRRYARPIIADEYFEVQDDGVSSTGQATLFDPEPVKAAVFKGLDMEELAEPKGWVVPITTLAASDYRLNAGFYKPQALSATQYDPPQQIIGELLDLEDRIRDGLNRLMRMVEGAE
jgi:hypothetical protein